MILNSTMIENVTRLTIFKNLFSKVGRKANKEIKKMSSMQVFGEIYQKKLSNGKIVLQQEEKYENIKNIKTIILDRNGMHSKIDRMQELKYPQERISIKKEYSTEPIKYNKREFILNKKSGKIEENAIIEYDKISYNHNRSINVKSYPNRKSTFPATRIAHSFYSYLNDKIYHKNGIVEYKTVTRQ